MALTKAQKAEQLSELKDKMQKSSSVMFAHYIGLTVADVSDLRQKLKDSKAEMKVAKKTLMQLAAKDLGLPDLDEKTMDGAVACIFSFEDPMTGAQVAFKYGKDHPQVELIGGLFDGKLLSKAEAMAFAKMPNRQQLLGIFAGMLQSPLRSFASMINSPLRSFAVATSELAKKGGVSTSAQTTVATPAAEAPAETAPAAEAAPAAETPASDSQPESPASPDLSAEASAKEEASESTPS
ncbi:MAG TPA: 50S ribosomal protein L10 [Candidatus Peribacteraceae bacterium]|nr:50S ribosomal protein L10 [Candidatus Peribacteraceae bacterium]